VHGYIKKVVVRSFSAKKSTPRSRVSRNSRVSPLSGRFLVDLILSSATEGLYAVQPRDVRLDINKRRSVKDVHTIEVEDIPFPADQFHDVQADSVGGG